MKVTWRGFVFGISVMEDFDEQQPVESGENGFSARAPSRMNTQISGEAD